MEKSENLKKEQDINKKRKDFFVIIITFIISIIVLIVLVNSLMNNSRVNEGKFRVSDVLLTSTAVLEDTSKETAKWTFNVHQKNKLSFLIVPSDEKFSAAITDIAATKKGLEIYQTGNEENKIVIADSPSLQLVTTKNEDGTVLYEIEILNKDVLKNFQIPEETIELSHNGTVFGLAGIKSKDLEYTLVFKFEMIDSNGKRSVMKVNLKLPQGDITTKGSSVSRLNLSEFVFKLK